MLSESQAPTGCLWRIKMITTENGELVATCNECGADQYGGTLEFADFIAELKRDGWKIRKGKDAEGDPAWTHVCPECC